MRIIRIILTAICLIAVSIITVTISNAEAYVGVGGGSVSGVSRDEAQNSYNLLYQGYRFTIIDSSGNVKSKVGGVYGSIDIIYSRPPAGTEVIKNSKTAGFNTGEIERHLASDIVVNGVKFSDVIPTPISYSSSVWSSNGSLLRNKIYEDKSYGSNNDKPFIRELLNSRNPMNGSIYLFDCDGAVMGDPMKSPAELVGANSWYVIVEPIFFIKPTQSVEPYTQYSNYIYGTITNQAQWFKYAYDNNSDVRAKYTSMRAGGWNRPVTNTGAMSLLLNENVANINSVTLNSLTSNYGVDAGNRSFTINGGFDLYLYDPVSTNLVKAADDKIGYGVHAYYVENGGGSVPEDEGDPDPDPEDEDEEEDIFYSSVRVLNYYSAENVLADGSTVTYRDNNAWRPMRAVTDTGLRNSLLLETGAEAVRMAVLEEKVWDDSNNDYNLSKTDANSIYGRATYIADTLTVVIYRTSSFVYPVGYSGIYREHMDYIIDDVDARGVHDYIEIDLSSRDIDSIERRLREFLWANSSYISVTNSNVCFYFNYRLADTEVDSGEVKVYEYYELYDSAGNITGKTNSVRDIGYTEALGIVSNSNFTRSVSGVSYKIKDYQVVYESLNNHAAPINASEVINSTLNRTLGTSVGCKDIYNNSTTVRLLNAGTTYNSGTNLESAVISKIDNVVGVYFYIRYTATESTVAGGGDTRYIKVTESMLNYKMNDSSGNSNYGDGSTDNKATNKLKIQYVMPSLENVLHNHGNNSTYSSCAKTDGSNITGYRCGGYYGSYRCLNGSSCTNIETDGTCGGHRDSYYSYCNSRAIMTTGCSHSSYAASWDCNGHTFELSDDTYNHVLDSIVDDDNEYHRAWSIVNPSSSGTRTLLSEVKLPSTDFLEVSESVEFYRGFDDGLTYRNIGVNPANSIEYLFSSGLGGVIPSAIREKLSNPYIFKAKYELNTSGDFITSSICPVSSCTDDERTNGDVCTHKWNVKGVQDSTEKVDVTSFDRTIEVTYETYSGDLTSDLGTGRTTGSVPDSESYKTITGGIEINGDLARINVDNGSGKDIRFYPYYRMWYLDSSNNLDEVEVVADYSRGLNLNSFIEIGMVTNGNGAATINSSQFSSHKGAKTLGSSVRNDSDAVNKVLPGGASYSVEGNNSGNSTLCITTYQPYVDSGVASQSVSVDSIYTNLSQVESNHNNVVEAMEQKISGMTLSLYFNSDKNISVDEILKNDRLNSGDRDEKTYEYKLNNDYGVEMNGSNMVSANDGKYLIGSGGNSLFNTTRTDSYNYYLISADTNGNISIRKKTTVDYNIRTTSFTGAPIFTIDKTQTISTVVLNDEMKRLNERTGIITALMNVLQRNLGNDNTVDASRGGKEWYNEAFDGIIYVVKETKLVISYKDNMKEISVIDPALSGKMDGRSDMWKSLISGIVSISSGSSLQTSSQWNGNSLNINYINSALVNMFKTNKIYIPNVNVQNMY